MSETTSKHFSLHEFAHREVPYPAEWVSSRWLPLAMQVLDPIREAWGSPLVVISGYRPQAFNDFLRSQGHNVAQFSQHIEGRAADLRPVPSSFQAGEDLAAATRRLHAIVLDMEAQGQLPLLGGLGVYDAGWIHADSRSRGADGHLARWSG